MKKLSAGLVVYRRREGKLEVLIVHMGSPWWAKKDKGAWSIPKGEHEAGADALANARREFKEELGQEPPDGEYMELGSIEQSNNKTVTAWAIEADLDASHITSNTLEMEWPPRSGKTQTFPEIDKAAYFDVLAASQKIVPGQIELLTRLAGKLGIKTQEPPEQSSLF